MRETTVIHRVFLMDLEVYARSFGKLIERDCAHYKRWFGIEDLDSQSGIL